MGSEMCIRDRLSIEGKKTFLDSGGEEFTYIDCLNDSDFGVKVIASLLEEMN